MKRAALPIRHSSALSGGIEHWVQGGKVEAMPVLKTAELKGILK